MHQQIAGNIRASWLLVVMTCVLLALVGGAMGAAGVAQVSDLTMEEALRSGGVVGVGIAGVLTLVMALVSYFAGDRCVLLASRARKIEKRDHPQLFNVVEEMALAGGLPLPEIYVINDSAPNAFATGRKPTTGKVAVTTGLLTKLNRDELQGVMAHELSHIRNYDILFATMMGVLVGTIALLCDGFWRSMRYSGRGRSRRSRGSGSGGGAAAILLIVVVILALLAPALSKLIQLAVSRKREYLADASAALLTRYPPGLASALRKLSGDREVLEVANRATQHLYIVNPIKPFEDRAKALFSTHPPTEERIQRLERMGGFSAEAPVEYARRQAPPAAVQHRPVGLGALTKVLGPLEGTVFAPTSAPAGPAAGLVAAGAAAVTPAAHMLGRCPRCRAELRTAGVAGDAVKGCRSCGGIWIREATLTELLSNNPAKLRNVDGKFLNFIGTGWERIHRKVCPECTGHPTLREVKVKGANDVPVDRCPRCQGVWFDDGELPIVVAAAERARPTVHS